MKQQQLESRDEAETIALRALGFLASDADRLGRFLTLTGIGPGELRARAGEPAFLAALLDHLLGDETLLLVFATEASVPPATIAQAHELLIGGERPAAAAAKRSAKVFPVRRR